MARCICKTMAHGHGDRCEREATEPDGMCKECHDSMPRHVQELLEEEQRDPKHLK